MLPEAERVREVPRNDPWGGEAEYAACGEVPRFWTGERGPYEDGWTPRELTGMGILRTQQAARSGAQERQGLTGLLIRRVRSRDGRSPTIGDIASS